MASTLNRKVSRRQLVKTIAGTTGALILAGCAPQAAPAPEPTKATTGPTAAPATAAAQPTPAPKKPVTVLWWRSLGAKAGEAMDAMAKGFNESQDVVTVQAEFQGSYRELETKLAAAVAAKSTPDLVMLADNGYEVFARNGNLAVLDDLIAGPNGVDLKGYYPVVERGAMGGKYYQLPLAASTTTLFYNEDMIKEAGFDGPPKTWDDLLNVYMPKLTVKEGGTTKVHGFAYRTAGLWWQQSFCRAHGQDISDDDYNVYLDHPVFIDFLTRWQKAFKDGLTIVPTSAEGDVSGYFASGKAAMAINSSADMTNLDGIAKGSFSLKVVHLPEGPAGKAAGSGGCGICLMSGLSADKRDAGWEFVRYTQEGEQVADIARATGYVPFTKAAEALYAPDIKEDPRRKVAIEQLDWAKPHVSVIRFMRTQQPLVEEAKNAVQSDVDPKRVAKKLQKEITDILKEEGLLKA